MKEKFTVTYIFALIGALTWAFTILLRGTSITSIAPINFILGIMPNISAAWFFIWIGEIIFLKVKREFNMKEAFISCTVVFILALLSEIVHQLFLNSPFDIYDIIATILASIIYLLVFKATLKPNKDRKSVV